MQLCAEESYDFAQYHMAKPLETFHIENTYLYLTSIILTSRKLPDFMHACDFYLFRFVNMIHEFRGFLIASSLLQLRKNIFFTFKM